MNDLLCLIRLSQGVSYFGSWLNATMQGMRGISDSDLHEEIMEDFRWSAMEVFAFVGAIMFISGTNIDDVVAAFLDCDLAQFINEDEFVDEVWEMLEMIYNSRGFQLDASKSGISSIRYVILSEYFIKGIMLGLSYRTECKAHYSHRNETPSSHQKIDARTAAMKETSRQVTSPSMCFIRCARNVAGDINVRRGSKGGFDAFCFATRCHFPAHFGGYNVPTIVEMVLGAAPDRPVHITELLRFPWA